MTLKPIIMDTQTIETVIPHRYPLLLIENIHELVPEKYILASYQLKENEPVFKGHFPEQPIYPGVYYIESIAQAGAVLIFKTREKNGFHDKALGFLSTVEKARFRKMCGPGDLLMFEVSIEKSRGPFWWLNGKVLLNEELVAEAKISVALGDSRS